MYSAFGGIWNTPAGVANDRRFSGEQYDSESDYIYLRARYYDPATGRFLSKDPAGGKLSSPVTQNKYVYAGNNPVNGGDPTGMVTYVTPDGRYTDDFNDYAQAFNRSRGNSSSGGVAPNKTGGGGSPAPSAVSGSSPTQPVPNSVGSPNCPDRTAGGWIAGVGKNSYIVQLGVIRFTVLENMGPIPKVGPFEFDLASAMVWDWMVIWGRGPVPFESGLYSHEVGHILQQTLYGNLEMYRAAMITSYALVSTLGFNLLERHANCLAGLPENWGGY